MLENSFYISIHKEKQIVHINRINNNTTLDCKTIHNIIFENLQENEAYRDISLQDVYSYEVYVFLESILLAGGDESKSLGYECFFGTLDSKDNNLGLDTLKPIYHLQASDEIIESTSNNRDSSNADSNNSLSTLDVFLNGSRLTLLNYSLLDSSLNIKLECNSSESKAIQEREKAQRDKDSSPVASNDKSQSTSMLHPILEDNEIKCPHNGVVQLKSNLGKSITDKNIPFILETDLLYSSIVGCPNPHISGGPCTQVAFILPSARGLKKHNDDYPIMQDLVSSGVFSDKGFPLICTPKPNSYKINAPSPTHTKNRDKESLRYFGYNHNSSLSSE